MLIDREFESLFVTVGIGWGIAAAKICVKASLARAELAANMTARRWREAQEILA